MDKSGDWLAWNGALMLNRYLPTPRIGRIGVAREKSYLSRFGGLQSQQTERSRLE